MHKSLNITKLDRCSTRPMESFVTKPKKWGNSLGVTIPKGIAQKERVSPRRNVTVFITSDETNLFDKIFGTFKLKRPTQEVLDEMDVEEYE